MGYPIAKYLTARHSLTPDRCLPRIDGERTSPRKAASEAQAMMQKLNAEREFFFRKEQALKPGKQYHDRAWVFLRRREAA